MSYLNDALERFHLVDFIPRLYDNNGCGTIWRLGDSAEKPIWFPEKEYGSIPEKKHLLTQQIRKITQIGMYLDEIKSLMDNALPRHKPILSGHLTRLQAAMDLSVIPELISAEFTDIRRSVGHSMPWEKVF